MSDDSQQYKDHVQAQINKLLPVFAKVSIGDFSQDIEIPEPEDEFTPLYAGVQIMLDVIRKQLDTLDELNQSLAAQLTELESAKKQVDSEKSVDEAILNSIGDGVVVLNSKTEIILANYQAHVLLGFSQEEMVQKLFGEVVQAFDEKDQPIPPDQRAYMIAMQTKQNYSFNCFYRKKDQTMLAVSVTAAPVITLGEELGIVLVFKDRSKEHQLQLMKDEFISLAAHQLRTPLSVMRWNIELLQKKQTEVLSPEIQEKLSTIYSSNDRMIAIVNDLLNISRLEQGKMTHNLEEVNVVDAIQTAVTEQQLLFESKKINFKLQFDSTQTYIIMVDPVKFHSVLSNLINNAIKFNSENGAVEITISQTPEKIVIEISDTGIGIPTEESHKIFDKFYRTSNAILAQTQGTGLGLFLVKSYLEAWNGSVTVKSPAHEAFRQVHSDQTQPGTTVVVELSKERKL